MNSIRKLFSSDSSSSGRRESGAHGNASSDSPLNSSLRRSEGGAYKSRNVSVKKRLIVSPTARYNPDYTNGASSLKATVSPRGGGGNTPSNNGPSAANVTRAMGRRTDCVPPALRGDNNTKDLMAHSADEALRNRTFVKEDSDIFSPMTPHRSDTFHDPREYLGESVLASANSGRTGGGGAVLASSIKGPSPFGEHSTPVKRQGSRLVRRNISGVGSSRSDDPLDNAGRHGAREVSAEEFYNSVRT